MIIRIRSSDGHQFSIPFPTALLTSPTLVNWAIKVGTVRVNMPPVNIPPEAIGALCRSIRQVKKNYGRWELVHVESADGDLVSIIL